VEVAALGMGDDEFAAVGADEIVPELIVKEGEDIDYRVVLAFYLIADLGDSPPICLCACCVIFACVIFHRACLTPPFIPCPVTL